MAITRRRQGVRNRRETDGIVKSFKAAKTVDKSLGIIRELFETENYCERTINDLSEYWAEFMQVAGTLMTDNITDVTDDPLGSYISRMLNVRDLSPVTQVMGR